MNHLQQFLLKIEQLSAQLRFPQPATGMLIKGIWSASLHWSGGDPFEDAEDFAYQRLAWRVQDSMAPNARPEEAIRLLAGSIPLGMLVFRVLEAQLDDPAEHAGATSFIDYLALLGFEPRLYMPRYAAA